MEHNCQCELKFETFGFVSELELREILKTPNGYLVVVRSSDGVMFTVPEGQGIFVDVGDCAFSHMRPS